MGKPKKVVEEAIEEPLEELGEAEELSDPEMEELVPEEEPKSPVEIILEEMDKIKSAHRKTIEAVAVNQKYIKKIWERQKGVEENFKTLIDSLQK